MAWTKKIKKISLAAWLADSRAKKGMTVVSLFLCVLFLVSAVMTSFAWYDFNQSKTNIFRGTVDNVDVVLEKVEKDAEGVIQANPVSPVKNAEFQLYLIETDGTETLLPGGPWYTDASGKITFDGRDEDHPKLAPGKYVFVETAPAFGYTYDKDDKGKDITRYEFEITRADALNNQVVTVSAYNRRGSGTLAVEKTVVGNAPADAEFTFTVTFSDDKAYSYSIDGGEKISVASGGTFKLKHGQTALFEGIPVGVQYRVVENEHPDYVVSSTGHQGSITEAGSVASFVNTYQPKETGSLTVTKEVQGDGADTNKVFEFTAVIGDETVNFTLKPGEEKIFTDLPIGTKYIITEMDYSADGYIATVKQYTGTITGTEGVILPFVNIYDDASDKKPGDLTVNKEVVGEGADSNKVFTFEITFEGEGAPESPQTFTLKAGESKVFTGIPAGVTYTVRETDAAGYLPELSVVTGVVASDEVAVVTFKNHVREDKVKLSVTKGLAGEYPNADKNKEFEFTLIIDGEELIFTLKPGETKKFEVLQGSQYEIIEKDYFADGYEQSIVGGFGTVAGEDIEVIVTNTFIGDKVIDIEGEKKWDLGGQTGVTLPESITVRLKNGDEIVKEQVVKPDENGDWKYSFTVPEYDEKGDKIKYTVEELPVAGFIPSYKGYNITNTYVAPVEADPPVATKVVQGENAPESKFAFVMKGLDGAPMPEGSVGDTKTMYLTGSGEVEFGNIRFTEPGTYRYTVHEKNGWEAGWTYDTAEYTIVFNVIEKDGKLTVADRTIERNGKSVDKVQFTNNYTDSPDNTVTVQGHKTWEHGTNPVANQPKNIILQVYADGELAVEWKVDEKDNWSYSFDLPKFAEDGHEIIYTVDEADVPNYEKAIDGYNLINTYIEQSDDSLAPSAPGSTPGGTPGDAPGNAPDTSDHSNLTLWIIIMVVSGTLLIILLLIRPKKRRGKKSK